VRSGKVRAIGFSEWTPDQIRSSFAVRDSERFTSSQPMYNALWRKPEREVIPLSAQEGIGQIVFCPLGQGVLTGKYQPGQPPPEDSRAANADMNGFIAALLADPVLEAVQRLRPVAEQAGLTIAQLALAWVLREQNVSSAIIGASRPSQIDDNAAASGVTLDTDTLAAIDDALGDVVTR
jgi:aryl-alcohol dehydrogenase-like predicted oxidoreductase